MLYYPVTSVGIYSVSFPEPILSILSSVCSSLSFAIINRADLLPTSKIVRVLSLSMLLMMAMTVSSSMMIKAQQTASAASWSSGIEDWLNGSAATWAQMCEYALKIYTPVQLSNDQQLIRVHNILIYNILKLIHG